jgi:tetratricopeptide (TPR) repeat protein
VFALAALVLLFPGRDAEAQGFCGTIYRAAEAASRAGRLDGADEYLRKTINCLGGNVYGSVPAHYARGMIGFSLGRAEAAEDLALAIERELRWRRVTGGFPPPRGRIHIGWTRIYRGLVLLRIARYQEALADFEAAAQWRDVRDPIDPHVGPRFQGFDFALDDAFRGVSLEAAAAYARGLVRLRNGDAAGGAADIAMAERLEPDLRARMSLLGLAP